MLQIVYSSYWEIVTRYNIRMLGERDLGTELYSAQAAGRPNTETVRLYQDLALLWFSPISGLIEQRHEEVAERQTASQIVYDNERKVSKAPRGA